MRLLVKASNPSFDALGAYLVAEGEKGVCGVKPWLYQLSNRSKNFPTSQTINAAEPQLTDYAFQLYSSPWKKMHISYIRNTRKTSV
jgi:hypothetical protein